jgi:hypothetical protein
MVPLSREIVVFLAAEFGRDEVLRRLSDPDWFQAFGCVLGFDWHSIGLTTTVCGALKEGLRGTENELGIFVAGGKGATSRKTPHEINVACDRAGCDAKPLVYASRMSAKVDNAAVQDGYQLYPSFVRFYRRRRLVHRPAGHERRNGDGAALSLAVGRSAKLRERAPRCGML